VLSTLERWVQTTSAVAAGTLRQPDLTVWFDLPPETAAARLADARAPDRFEAQPLAFFRLVVAGYAARVAADPSRFARIQADQSRHQVWQQLTATFVRRGWLSIMVAANSGPK
jgi:dTMP kinase